MVLDPSSVLNVEGGSSQVTLSVSVKLHWGGGVVWEPPSPMMDRQPEHPPPSNLSPQQ